MDRGDFICTGCETPLVDEDNQETSGYCRECCDYVSGIWEWPHHEIYRETDHFVLLLGPGPRDQYTVTPDDARAIIEQLETGIATLAKKKELGK